MKLTTPRVRLLMVAGVLMGPVARARTYDTVKPGQDGILACNGVITPLDQEMRNFYIRNNDGMIEVKLTEHAVIGLQSRIQRR